MKKAFGVAIVLLVLVVAFFYVSRTNHNDPAQKPTSEVASKASKSLDTRAPGFVAGKHYQVFPNNIRDQQSIRQLMAREKDHIQVLEFFNYGCRACGNLHDDMTHWLKTKPKDVTYHRFPIIFHRTWEMYAKVFYMLESMKKLDKFDNLLFKAIHEEKRPLGNERKLKLYFEEQGVPAQTFEDFYHSFVVQQHVDYAQNIAKAYEVSVSPSVIINGPHLSYVTNPSLVNTTSEFITLINFLVKQQLDALRLEQKKS